MKSRGGSRVDLNSEFEFCITKRNNDQFLFERKSNNLYQISIV